VKIRSVDCSGRCPRHRNGDRRARRHRGRDLDFGGGDLFVLLLTRFRASSGSAAITCAGFPSPRYTIASTPTEMRVGFGLFSTSNETLPPGRIHSIEVSQWLCGRLVADPGEPGHHTTSSRARQTRPTRPSCRWSLADVAAVPALHASGLHQEETSAFIETGMTSKERRRFHRLPLCGRRLRPFSWRRKWIRHRCGLVAPASEGRDLATSDHRAAAALQSVEGPLLRRLRLASVHLHMSDRYRGPRGRGSGCRARVLHRVADSRCRTRSGRYHSTAVAVRSFHA
jgi:putative membrane protein